MILSKFDGLTHKFSFLIVFIYFATATLPLQKAAQAAPYSKTNPLSLTQFIARSEASQRYAPLFPLPPLTVPKYVKKALNSHSGHFFKISSSSVLNHSVFDYLLVQTVFAGDEKTALKEFADSFKTWAQHPVIAGNPHLGNEIASLTTKLSAAQTMDSALLQEYSALLEKAYDSKHEHHHLAQSIKAYSDELGKPNHTAPIVDAYASVAQKYAASYKKENNKDHLGLTKIHELCKEWSEELKKTPTAAPTKDFADQIRGHYETYSQEYRKDLNALITALAQAQAETDQEDSTDPESLLIKIEGILDPSKCNANLDHRIEAQNTVRHPKSKSLESVRKHIEEELKKGTKPEELTVILDVDGILTDASEPDWIQDPLRPNARPNALELVNYLKANKIPFLASSAHSSFEETLKKIKHIGLGDAFECNNWKSEDTLNKPYTTTPGQELFYAKCGKVVSVKQNGTKNYDKKAFAPLAGLTAAEAAEFNNRVKKVFFVDDRAKNFTNFQTDRDTALGSTRHVEYFPLSWIGPVEVPAREPRPEEVDPSKTEQPRKPTDKGRYRRDTAGAIVYTVLNGKTYVLLGKDKTRKEWDIMLGSFDKDPDKSAIGPEGEYLYSNKDYLDVGMDELFEETAGVFKVDKAQLKDMDYSIQVDRNSKNRALIHRQTCTFLVRVNHKPEQTITGARNKIAQTGMLGAKKLSPQEIHALTEMDDYAWVPLEDIQREAPKPQPRILLPNGKKGPRPIVFQTTTASGRSININLRDIATKIFATAHHDGTLDKAKAGTP